MGQLIPSEFDFYACANAMSRRLIVSCSFQFEPAPRRGEPDVTRRTPDYFLWLNNQLVAEFEPLVPASWFPCSKTCLRTTTKIIMMLQQWPVNGKKKKRVKEAGEASFDSLYVLSWTTLRVSSKEAAWQATLLQRMYNFQQTIWYILFLSLVFLFFSFHFLFKFNVLECLFYWLMFVEGCLWVYLKWVLCSFLPYY